MNIRQLARILKKSHKQTRSWLKTGAAFYMSKGMAYRIAHEGYEPADPVLRNALGLPPRVCPKCQRRITAPRQAPKRIADMSAKELLYCLVNRSEMK